MYFLFFFTCLCGGSYAQTMRVMTWFSGRELSDTAECRFVRSWKLCVRFLWKGEKKYIKRGFSTGKSSVVAYYSENAINISWPFISSHAKRLMRIKRALTLVYTKKRWCNCQFFFIASNIFRKALQKMGSFELTRKQLAHTTLENNLGREMKGRVLKGLTLSKKKRVPLCNTRWWMLA